MRPPRFVFLALCIASTTASAQDAGVSSDLEPLEVMARRAEGLVSNLEATDAGTPRALKDFVGQPVILYRLRCPECAELERNASVLTNVLADTGVPVVILLGGKGSTKKAAEKLLAKSPRNTRLAYGKTLTGVGGYNDVWLYGADGQPRAAMNVYSEEDGWALRAAAHKLLAEAGAAAPVTKPRVRIGEPFPPVLVEGLLGGSPDAGPATLDAYLGQPHVIFLACPACGGASDLEAFLPIAAPYRLPVVALVSHVSSTRENAQDLAKQLGPRPGLRIGWGAQLTPNVLRYSASTALLVDRYGTIRFAARCSSSELQSQEWVLRAGLERLQKEK